MEDLGLELNLIRAFLCYYQVLADFRMLNPKVPYCSAEWVILKAPDWREDILDCFDGIATESVPEDIKRLRVREAAAANASLARDIANEMRST